MIATWRRLTRTGTRWLIHRPPARRSSFTLTELLVVISLLTILATALLFTLQTAMEYAKESRTKAQIAKLHGLLMEKWESYRTRAIPVQVPLGIPARTEPFTDLNGNGHWDTNEPYQDTNGNNCYDVGAAGVRLAALRELMRMELPERIGDLVDPPRTIVVRYDPNGTNTITRTMAAPSLWRSYCRRAGCVWDNTKKVMVPPATWTRDYQFSECLYLIVASIRNGDSSALDFFQESEIGDVDGDGQKEILDAWGRPIFFLRWAPGFTYTPGADGQWGVATVDDNNLAPTDDLAERGWQVYDPASLSDDERVSDLQSINASLSPDPFDPLQVDGRWTDSIRGNEPFALIPLIFSAGRDGRYEVWDPEPPIFQYASVANDPYRLFTDSATGKQVQIGTPFDGDGDGVMGSEDNITNHLIEAN